MHKKNFNYKTNADLVKDAGSDSLVGTIIQKKSKIIGEITQDPKSKSHLIPHKTKLDMSKLNDKTKKDKT